MRVLVGAVPKSSKTDLSENESIPNDGKRLDPCEDFVNRVVPPIRKFKIAINKIDKRIQCNFFYEFIFE